MVAVNFSRKIESHARINCEDNSQHEEELVVIAQQATSCLVYTQATSVDPQKPDQQDIFAVAFRYIVVEIMACRIQVLGPVMNAYKWWGRLMHLTLTTYLPLRWGEGEQRTLRELPRVSRLSCPLVLVRGIHPSKTETVGVKEGLFCRQSGHFPSRVKTVWDPGRELDRDPIGDS